MNHSNGQVARNFKNNKAMDIDFVITWVDMNDPEWKKSFAKVKGTIDNSQNQYSEARFRDYGFLKYWFRGVEKFAPWVRKIHFVTCGQKPEWLDTSNPKLHLVNHSDYIPEKYLPTFNSTVLEFYLDRIPGLAEHFVYFNDDFYLTSPTGPDRFFAPNGLPHDIAVFRMNTGLSLWSKTLRNNVRLINRHFDKKAVLKRDHDKWFSPVYGSKANLTRLFRAYGKFLTIRIPHNAQPYLKSTFASVWDACRPELEEASTHTFRSETDLTPELFRTWQICKSDFEPYNTYKDTKMFPLMVKPKQAVEAIREQKYKLVCINDSVHIRNYEQVMQNLEAAFQSILPDKSSFEL